jgi:hypothetical protein
VELTWPADVTEAIELVRARGGRLDWPCAPFADAAGVLHVGHCRTPVPEPVRCITRRLEDVLAHQVHSCVRTLEDLGPQEPGFHESRLVALEDALTRLLDPATPLHERVTKHAVPAADALLHDGSIDHHRRAITAAGLDEWLRGLEEVFTRFVAEIKDRPLEERADLLRPVLLEAVPGLSDASFEDRAWTWLRADGFVPEDPLLASAFVLDGATSPFLVPRWSLLESDPARDVSRCLLPSDSPAVLEVARALVADGTSPAVALESARALEA